MPLCFQFVNAQTGEPVNLQEIDRLMYAEEGKPENPEVWSNLYTYCTVVGCIPSLHDPNGNVDPVKLEVYLSKEEGMQEWAKARVRKYLVGEYRLNCWYQRHK